MMHKTIKGWNEVRYRFKRANFFFFWRKKKNILIKR